MELKNEIFVAKDTLIQEEILIFDEQESYREERLYFSLVEAAGSYGCYQVILFILFTMVAYLEASLIFISPYLLHQTPFICSTLDQDCSDFVCSLPKDQRDEYLPSNSEFYSVADHFGGFRCETADSLKVVETMIFLGGAIGLCSFSLFTERLGRKLSLGLALVFVITGLFLIRFSWNLEIVAIGIFVTICGTENCFQYLYCFSSEVVAEEKRIQFINGLNVCYGIGIMANSLTFYFLKDWRTVITYCHIFPAVFTLLAFIFVIQRTPLDLLANQSSQQILESLRKIAKINNKESFNLSIEKIDDLKTHYKSQSSHSHHLSSLDLFRFPSLLKFTFPLMMINLAAIYLFFAPTFIIKENQSDLFSNGIISGISFSASSLFVYYMMVKMQRRFSMNLLFFIIILMSVVMCFIDLDLFRLFQKIFYFFFRLVVSIMFNISFIVIYEIYPTQIRAAGSAFQVFFGEIAGVFQPWIANFCNSRNLPFESTFIIISVASMIAVYLLKETHQVPPPEIIDELKIKRP